MSGNTGPGWKKYPKHRITTKPAGVRVQIKFKGEVIADTRAAIQLEETHVGHVVAPVIYYIPRKDVKMERLVRTSHETSCPFKRSEEHTSELQSHSDLVCRLLLEKKNNDILSRLALI